MNNCPFEVHVMTENECKDFTAGWEDIQVYEHMQLKTFRWVLNFTHKVNRVRENLAQFFIWLAGKLGGYTVFVEIYLKQKEE